MRARKRGYLEGGHHLLFRFLSPIFYYNLEPRSTYGVLSAGFHKLKGVSSRAANPLYIHLLSAVSIGIHLPPSLIKEGSHEVGESVKRGLRGMTGSPGYALFLALGTHDMQLQLSFEVGRRSLPQLI